MSKDELYANIFLSWGEHLSALQIDDNVGDLNNKVVADGFFREFLNILLHCNFINTGATQQNTTCVDFVDREKKVIVLIPVTGEIKLLPETINQILAESEAPETGDWHLYFMPITEEASIAGIEFTSPDSIIFDANKDVLNDLRLMELVLAAEDDVIEELSKLVDKYSRASDEQENIRNGYALWKHYRWRAFELDRTWDLIRRYYPKETEDNFTDRFLLIDSPGGTGKTTPLSVLLPDLLKFSVQPSLIPRVMRSIQKQHELDQGTMHGIPNRRSLQFFSGSDAKNSYAPLKAPTNITRSVDFELYDLLVRINGGYLPTPEEREILKNKETLDLTNSRIKNFPDSICELSNLSTLVLRGTMITDLPSSIQKLQKLTTVDLQETAITSLPHVIECLSQLQTLILNNTRIDNINLLQNLSSLRKLCLKNTKISKLPDWIGDLPELDVLDLSETTLDRIPASLATKGLRFVSKAIPESNTVNLYRTILREQDISVFLETPELIQNLYKDKLITLRESKVIFLGDGGVGKSYTISRFREDGRKETSQKPYITKQTPGVKILDYKVKARSKKKQDSFTIHFWDFGGQELLHAMHRCFLTDETCYVVMVRTRDAKADERATYWLRNVAAFAPQSPVLLFVNCWENDDGKRSINEPQLLRNFPNIQKVVYCSAKNSSKEEFKEKVINEIILMAAESNGCRRTVSQKWNDVRLAIRDSQLEGKHCLSKKQYHTICAEKGIEDENAPALLTFFNNLGVCFSYHRDKEKTELAAYRLLTPVWLTNALYAIIEEGRAYARTGQILLSSVVQMLGSPPQNKTGDPKYQRTEPGFVYSQEQCRYVIDVAVARDLCYRIDKKTLFFPALCDNNTTDEALNPPENLLRQAHYQFRYKYLPDSVVHQLMVRCMRLNFFVSSCWLKGMVLKVLDEHMAVIRMEGDTILCVDIYSKEKDNCAPFELFERLRELILAINMDLNLEAQDFIAAEDDSFSVIALLKTLNSSETIVGNSGTEYNVLQLLGRFYSNWTIQLMKAEGKQLTIPILPRKFNECRQNDPALRYALFKVYNRVCPYCGKPFESIKEMQVDHILPKKSENAPRLESEAQFEVYFNYLRESCGFNMEKPDYIENYLPCHSDDNKYKSNYLSLFPLVSRHELAARNAQKVLDVMDAYRKRK